MTRAHSVLTDDCARWLAARDRGFRPEEKAAFDAWLANPLHAQAFRRADQMWAAMTSLQYTAETERTALILPARRRRAPLFILTGALAAAATLVLLVRLNEPSSQPSRSASFSYVAPADTEARIQLPDGSVALLHRGSRLAYMETDDGRQVSLLSGQAHFTVAKPSPKAFFVHAGSVTVRDIGTAFNVRLAPDEVAVLVTEGQVEVTHADSSVAPVGVSAAPAPATPAAKPLLLVAGQEAILGPRSGEFALTMPIPAAREQTLAWKSRRLAFDRTPLFQAIAELNRYNTQQLVLGDPSLASVAIAGGVQSDNLDGFLTLLDSGFGITAETRGNEIVLRKAP